MLVQRANGRRHCRGAQEHGQNRGLGRSDAFDDLPAVGDLQQLLAALATRRLVPEPVEDTGSLAGDLAAWLEPYVEGISSALGRQILR